MTVTIVAEVGINHNADIDVALQLCDAAKEAGADLVKFQKREPRLSVPTSQWDVPKDTPWGTIPYIVYKERMELSLAQFDIIDAYCRSIGLPWFVSPWDVPSLHVMQRFDLPMWKVASASLTNDRLLEEMARDGQPVVLATGMSTMDEVRHAVSVLAGHVDLTVCHCNSSYPCPPEDLNLRCIQTLRDEFPGLPIGYSGHEVGLSTTVAAVALGATYIERHITLDRAMWGTDQAASVEPQGFRRLVRDIRTVEAALGDGVKRVSAGELPVMAKLRGAYA